MTARPEILLVEDNPHDVELTLRAFERNRLSNRIHVCRDGEAALDFLFADGASHDLSVILLDLKLPKIGGREVLRRLKAEERTRLVPVVALTASREEADLIETYSLGVASYIVKPIDFDKLTEAVRLIGMYWLLLNKPPALAAS
jgi:two-component system response regulator